MLNILKQAPIESNGTVICFDREPDIFSLAELKYDNPVYTGFFRGNELLGFVLMGYFSAFINGNLETICYLTNLYVKEKGRYKGFYYRASEFLFKDSPRNCRIGYSIIMKGNKKAESHISRLHKNFPYLPYSKIIGTLNVKTILILFRKRQNKKYKIRKARESDIDAMVSFLYNEFSKRLFAPYIDKNQFLKNLRERPNFSIENYYIAEYENKMAGLCAAWDCSSFKQTRVLKYNKQMKWVKIFYSFLSFVFRLPELPEEGKSFKDIYITDYAVKDKNPLIMKSLLTKIYNDYKNKKYNFINFGSCEKDPLLDAVQGFISLSTKSHIIIGSNNAELLDGKVIDESLPYIDIPFL